ncbi:MAG: hypothetical protein AAF766_23635 [Cyanobacteria bacterium P01_D01_bin.14]
MNASAQALSIDMMYKIACIPALFRAEFSSAQVDLSPWAMDEKAQREYDPDSLDFGFSFPGWHLQLNCGCVLLQVYLSRSNGDSSSCLRGLKASGHGMHEQFWQISDSTDWQFRGKKTPSDACQQKLKQFFHQVCNLFDHTALLPQVEK